MPMSRRMKRTFGLTMIGVSLLACPMPGLSQYSSIELDSLAKLSHELEPALGALRFRRDENLEDSLMRGYGSAWDPTLRIHIYQLQHRPQQDEALPQNLPTMYLAISATTGNAYRLYGFPSAEADFNRMARDMPSRRLANADRAESRALFCAEVVYGLSPAWWLDGDSSVKLQAANHFFAESHKDGLLLAEKWWTHAKGDRSQLKIVTSAKDKGFETMLPIFWAPVEVHSVPEVKLYRIDVSDRGECTIGEPSVVLR